MTTRDILIKLNDLRFELIFTHKHILTRREYLRQMNNITKLIQVYKKKYRK